MAMLTEKDGTEEWNYDMVAAIDFGTTFSGYGFSFKDNVHDIVINKDWGGEMSMQMHKTPTTVLIDGNRKFVAFGHKAEYEYGKLSKADLQKFDIFRNFKMMLYYEKNITRSSVIESVSGRTHEALEIFSMALKFLKDHLIDAISQQGNVPIESRIKWVLTIPAIWNDNAKKFMREAAYKAGLIGTKTSKQLTLALEPEAASVLYRKLEVNHFKEVPDEMMDLKFPAGTQYMLIDAGGGTVDIATHEILQNGNIKEITYASGGNWGGSEVNNHFQHIIENVLGKDFIHTFRNDNQRQWFKLINSFEKKKREINIDNITDMQVDFPHSIYSKFKDETGKDIEDVIKNDSAVSLDEDGIVISSKIVSQLFNTVIFGIVEHVKEKLLNENIKELQYIILAGGFGECKLLYNRLKQVFSDHVTVISPHGAGMSIIKGAVLFGYNPSIITTRIARKTYGYGLGVPFIDSKHDHSKKHLDDSGEAYCHIFEVFVHKNDPVEQNSVNTTDLKPWKKSSKKVEFSFYSTERNDVIYDDDPRLTIIGKLTFDLPPLLPDSKENRRFDINIKFGGTEIEVAVHEKYKKDGKIKNLTIDFLAD